MPSVQLSFWVGETKYLEYLKNKSMIRAVLRDELYRLLGQERRSTDDEKKPRKNK